MSVADSTIPASLLRNVPVLAGLADELIDELVEQLARVQVRAGRWIMREGEVAESVYIVAGGRVEVVDERPPETLIRVLRRGAVLGELALLRAGTRSAWSTAASSPLSSRATDPYTASASASSAVASSMGTAPSIATTAIVWGAGA